MKSECLEADGNIDQELDGDHRSRKQRREGDERDGERGAVREPARVCAGEAVHPVICLICRTRRCYRVGKGKQSRGHIAPALIG